MTVLSHLTNSVLRDYETIKTTLKSEMIILLDDFPQKRFVLSPKFLDKSFFLLM